MKQVDYIPASGQFSVVFDNVDDVFSSTYKHEDGDLYFLNVNRELSEFEWVQMILIKQWIHSNGTERE